MAAKTKAKVKRLMASQPQRDEFNSELTYNTRPPETLAEIGRVRDPFMARENLGEVTPEALAALMRGSADLSQVMAFCKRMLIDDHIFACMRTLANSVAALPWEVLPFDESAEAKRIAKDCTDFLNGLRWLTRVRRMLVFGEFYPLAGVGVKYDPKSWLPTGYVRINPVRWHRDQATNSLRIRTVAEPTKGELVDPRAYLIHSSALEPGEVWDGGLWKKVAWPWMFTKFAEGEEVRFTEAFGQPIIWAFIKRPEDKEPTLEALTDMGSDARGVFPEGTEIDLVEPQRYGSVNLFDSIIKRYQGGVSKVILGHILNVDAESGTGTLAGGAAENVKQENKEAVAEGQQETLQDHLLVPYVGWHHGWDIVQANQVPTIKIKSEPPADLEKKAQTYVYVNQALAQAGRTIDPSQIEDEFAVRTVDKVIDIEPVEDADGTGEMEDEDEPKRKASRASRALAARRRIRTFDDTQAIAEKLGGKAFTEFAASLAKKLEASESIEAWAESIWEEIEELDATKLATVLYGATITAALIGRGDAGE